MENGENEFENNSGTGNENGSEQKADPFAGGNGNGYSQQQDPFAGGNGSGYPQQQDPFAGGNGSGYSQQQDPFAGGNGNGYPQQQDPFAGGNGNGYPQQNDPFAAYDNGYTKAPNNNAYGQPMNQYGQYGQPGQPGQDGSQAMAIAGMVLGILSIVCCCSVYPALLMAVVGFSLSLVVLVQKKPGRGMAIAGIVCSCIGALIVIVSLFISGLVYDSDEMRRIQQELLNELQDMDM